MPWSPLIWEGGTLLLLVVCTHPGRGMRSPSSLSWLGGALGWEGLITLAPSEHVSICSAPLQINIGVFLAELFLCFEVLKPDFVRPKELGGLKGTKGLT